MIKTYMRKDLQNYIPYHAPEKPYDVKLDANENPYTHDPDVIRAMKDWIEDCEHMRRYPDTDCHMLRDAIAKFWQVDKEEVICGVGSDQLIESIVKIFVEPGDKVLMPTPSFSMYQLATTLNRGIPVEFSLDENFQYPIDQIIKAYHDTKPKCVFLCTPNNPTGSSLTIEDMKKLLEVIDCPVVIDEAYGEFNNQTMIDYIDKYENMIVLRTFSKAYGCAGLRVGYGIGSQAMIEALTIVLPPYHLNAFSQYMAKTILEKSEHYKNNVTEIVKERGTLYTALSNMDYVSKIYPSDANYILIKVSRNDIVAKLEEAKVLVRGYGTTGPLGHCIRITVGTEEENKKLIEVMKTI